MELPDVRPGQVWEDCDQRARGRRITVEHVGGRYAYVKDSRGRHSRIAIERMRPTSTGYRLLKESTDE